MAEDRLDLQFKVICNVHFNIGLVTVADVELADIVGRVAFVGQVGIEHGVVSGGKDGFEGDEAGVAMVGMVDVPAAGDIAIGAVADDQLGPNTADFATDAFADFGGGAQKSVLLIHKQDMFDTAEGGGFALLLFAHEDELVAGDEGVVVAFVTVGQDHVGDLDALARHLDGGTGAGEVGVIGVGHDNKGAFDLRPVRWLAVAGIGHGYTS